MKSNSAIRTCGWIWLFAGVLLLRKGVEFATQLSTSTEPAQTSSWFAFLCEILGSSQRASILLILMALAIGFMKARTVMSKAALRNIERLHKQESVSIPQLFDTKMWILMISMMGIGMLINRLHLAFEWRVLIDVAVGTALMIGASQYLKESAYTKA